MLNNRSTSRRLDHLGEFGAFGKLLAGVHVEAKLSP
jgi:hypothetical protein